MFYIAIKHKSYSQMMDMINWMRRNSEGRKFTIEERDIHYGKLVTLNNDVIIYMTIKEDAKFILDPPEDSYDSGFDIVFNVTRISDNEDLHSSRGCLELRKKSVPAQYLYNTNILDFMEKLFNIIDAEIRDSEGE